MINRKAISGNGEDGVGWGSTNRAMQGGAALRVRMRRGLRVCACTSKCMPTAHKASSMHTCVSVVGKGDKYLM